VKEIRNAYKNAAPKLDGKIPFLHKNLIFIAEYSCAKT
jgi:hypothetical protein